MTPTATNGFTRPAPTPATDPYFYGWRDVVRELPGGGTETYRVPLTEYDVLHPQEDDHIAHTDVHDTDCHYLKNVFQAQTALDPSALVYHDVGVYWDDPALGHHSPDLTVIFGARFPRTVPGMFHVAREGVRPTLLVEIVSPSTRNVDLNDKVREYHQAGVPLYVIADRDRPEGPPRLIGYRHAPGGYEEFPPDDRGRLWLEPVRLWLGTVDNRVVCYDEAGRELGNYTAVTQALAGAEARAAEAQARVDAEARRADAAEAKVRELEERLRQLGGG